MKKPPSYYPLLVVYALCFYAVFVLVKVLTALGWPRQRRTNGNRVLFLECMGPPSAGFRHRSQGWVNALNTNGREAVCWFVLPYNQQWKLQQTASGMLRLQLIYLFKRFVQCFKSAQFDTAIVRRELLLYNDYGRLFFEKWMRRIHTNLILDVDDDIGAAKREPRRISAFGKAMMEEPEKFKSSLRYYDRVVAASDYLKRLFVSYGNGPKESDVFVVPTCVDYYKQRRKVYGRQTNATRIGWVGSAYNLHNLYSVYPALDELSLSREIELVVICNAVPKSADFPVTFVEWNEVDELGNLLQIDVGIMPLVDTDISKGKGGFKLIQYMGCGIVSVATALTINKEIVTDGVNGFLVNHRGDWTRVLCEVLNQKERFESIGARAAETIRQRYSYEAHLNQYLQILNATPVERMESPNHQPVK